MQAIVDQSAANVLADQLSPAQKAAADPRFTRAYTDYLIWALEHDRATYRWNHISSIVIFYVVMFLVLSGVWFSWMQFRLAHRTPPQGVATIVPSSVSSQTAAGSDTPTMTTGEKDPVTEFSASPHGIKIASSTIGVIILVISMCFFYLYLEKVYRITLIPAGESGASHSAVPK
jgi:hypothetical protein